MSKWRWPRISWRSLRFRLIGWYVLLLVLTVAVFSVYFYFQFRDLQQNQQDANLQAAFNRIRPSIDLDRGYPRIRRFPGGGGGGGGGTLPPDLNLGNIQVRLIAPDGTVVDSLGNFVTEMPAYLPTRSDFVSLTSATSGQWRVYTQAAVGRDGTLSGWIEVGQPAVVVDTEVSRLFAPILLGAGLALVLAVLGGLFLANQALQPIDRVTRTAQAISTRDLSRRINYHGPADEIGRLAKTLDQMLDRLEKGFEQERRFTSDASHELRTPLTALKGRIEVTLSRPRSEAEYQETLADLNQEVNRLVRLSNSLLYLARLDQAGHAWQTELLNLSDVLESVIESMESVAELKGISLTGQLVPDVQMQGNLDQLTRLFLNLIDNALKYTSEGGKVTVSLERTENSALVSISDTGPGIAPEHLPNIFKRFYRAESDRASASGGAGLGLAIAYEIARQHDGMLDIESELGKGTTLKVQLPLTEPSKHK